LAVPRPLQSLIVPQAYPLSGALAALAALCAVFGWSSAALVALALCAANLAFFRNPRRRIAGDDRSVVSPADGRVVEVVRVEDPEGFVGPAWRIAIFLSVLNVHVNRVPLAGKVRALRRKGSHFLAAFNPDASSRNVQARMDVEAADGTRYAVVQITGLIARRIVSYPGEGDTLLRGEPYGLICYGSRVELYLPESARVTVEPGARARGGSTVLAELGA
jgi:phosphatidylserine decarboxylase